MVNLVINTHLSCLTCEGGGGPAVRLGLGWDGLEGRERGLGELHPQQGQGAELPRVRLLGRGGGVRALVLLLELLLHVGREDAHLLHLVIQSPGGDSVLSTRLESRHACKKA